MSLDKFTGSDSVIDFVHTRVHDGKYFRTGNIFLNVAASTSVDFFLDMSTDEEYHTEIEVISSSQFCIAYILENVTVGANGTTVPVINLNRHKPLSSTVSVFHTPTNATGTAVGSAMIPGGLSKQVGRGGARSNATEYVLAEDKYLIRVVNEGSTSTSIEINAEWYKFED